MTWSRHYGKIFSEKPSLFGDNALVDLAMICINCGFIEFYLDQETLKKLKKEGMGKPQF